MIIAVDYDGTLELRSHDGKSVMNYSLIKSLQRAQSQGGIIILWTCRTGKRLLDAMKKLRSCGFAPNYVNQNAPLTIARLGYDPRKILADVYIDDKSLRP